MKFKRQRIVWNAKKAERVKEDDDKAHNWCGNGKQMSRIFRGYNRKRANQWWGHYTHSFFIFYFLKKRVFCCIYSATSISFCTYVHHSIVYWCQAGAFQANVTRFHQVSTRFLHAAYIYSLFIYVHYIHRR